MSEEKDEFSVDRLMDRVYEGGKTKLNLQEKDQLLNEAHSERWLILQRALIQEVNGLLNKLSILKLGDPGALEVASRMQGEIAGLRRFWIVLEELIKNPEEVKS